jgi:hypothetical protein
VLKNPLFPSLTFYSTVSKNLMIYCDIISNMGRKKIKKDGEEDMVSEPIVRDEIRVFAYAIGCFVLFAFFMLAAFDKAGIVGSKTYSIFSILFGVGYYLLPTIFLILTIAFAKSIRGTFTKVRAVGATIFFISCLALLDLMFNEKGGVVGNALHKPLVRLFDTYASAIILGALAIVSVIVVLDAQISIDLIKNIFRRKQPDETEIEEKRRDFFLYVDEFQNFATPDFATILSEARKYRLGLTVANQFIGQMDEEVKNAVFGNVGSLVCFRVGVTDASYIAREFQPVFSETDLINVDRFHSYMKTIVNNEPVPPFSVDMTKDFATYKAGANQKISDAIVQLSRLKYGKPRELVEAETVQRARL